MSTRNLHDDVPTFWPGNGRDRGGLLLLLSRGLLLAILVICIGSIIPVLVILVFDMVFVALEEDMRSRPIRMDDLGGHTESSGSLERGSRIMNEKGEEEMTYIVLMGVG